MTDDPYDNWTPPERPAPILTDPTRAALVRQSWVTGYTAQGDPTYEARIQCDDGEVRSFVSGPAGRWVLKV